jgi:RNA polymerase II subunit A small phosphatase-like protein
MGPTRSLTGNHGHRNLNSDMRPNNGPIRPSIVFDLDDTLILASQVRPQTSAHFTIRVRRRQVFIRTRLGLATFLSRVQKLYDVFFFTASRSDYANQIIHAIALLVLASRRFSHNDRRCHARFIVKDLRVLRRPLGNTILIDDSP